MRPWWEDAVFYQIYPRSFMDSNADGVGDLAGIASKLDYLSALGVDALWLSPFFPSPMEDFGYDISDYRGVDPIFGDLADFSRLVAAVKARGMRIVLDLVANHSSDRHPWFEAARSSKDDPKHPWYIWKPETGKPPNNWKAQFELGSAWHPNPATGERYLGTFTRHQPEFDWRNAELRDAIYDVMRYWFGLGTDGFRLDVATAYFKDPEFRSNPFSFRAIPDFFQKHLYDRNHPDFHAVFREMRSLADAAGDRVLVGETHGSESLLAASCYGAGDELHMAFNFDFLHMPWKAGAFRRSAERWYSRLGEGAWPNFTLSNHDQPRHAWRYRSRDPRVTEGRGRVAAAMLLTLRGTPFLYYGEEIGMTCFRLPRAALRDPLGIRTWPLRSLGRDGERTPMQWDASPNAGFSTGGAWLPANPDYPRRNVEDQGREDASLLGWYRRLIALRRARPELRSGTIRFLDLGREVLAYERSGPGRVVVILNFSSRPRTVSLDEELRLLAGSDRVEGSILAAGELTLDSCEAIVGETA